MMDDRPETQGQRRLPYLRTFAAALIGLVVVTGLKLKSDIQLIWGAYLYAYTPYTFEQTLQNFTNAGSPIENAAWNTLLHGSDLATPEDRTVTTRNADTIYSIAALDLSNGPVYLSVPDETERYFSVAFLDVFTDNFHSIGTRKTGGQGGDFTIVSPNDTITASEGHGVIQAPTESVWLLIRVLVREPEDLAAAVAFQTSITLKAEMPSTQSAPLEAGGLMPDVDTFLESANRALSWVPKGHPHYDRGLPFRALGLGPDAKVPSVYGRFLWKRALKKGFEALSENLDKAASAPGWRRPPSNLGLYGEDDALRSAVAIVGLGALENEEALYFSANTGPSGAALEGRRGYTFTVPPSGIPARAFWSLTMYKPEPDGRYFLFDNPLDRYLIGDRTEGLSFEEDGSIVIRISADRPTDESNWLPAPEGPFQLTLRLYIPDAEALDPSWSPPEVFAQ